MSNFGDSEAEEDSLDESLSNKSDDEEEEDEEGEEEDGQEIINDDANDIINDEEEEEEEEEEAHHHHRKRRKGEHEDDLDEEDLSLIEENLGISIKRKKPKLKKVKLLDSDDEEEDQSGNSALNDREAIANELFEGDEDTPEVPAEPAVQPEADDTYADIEDSESEEDVDDFIVDDEGNPIRQAKKKRRLPGAVHDSALMEAQDIFGLDFDFDEFEKYGRDDFSSDEDEDEYEEEDGEVGALRQQKKKSTKKSIYEVFEPSELEKGMLTSKDSEIRNADVPERFQVRDFAVKSTEDGELDDEAQWIY